MKGKFLPAFSRCRVGPQFLKKKKRRLGQYRPLDGIPTLPPSQVPFWKSTDKDRPNQSDPEAKAGCFHLEISWARPLQKSSISRARIILGSSPARVLGRCGVPVPEELKWKYYCEKKNTRLQTCTCKLQKMLPKISSNVPLRQPSFTWTWVIKPVLARDCGKRQQKCRRTSLGEARQIRSRPTTSRMRSTAG